MKVKLLFFFSFVFVSAALVQHGATLSLSNTVEGSENSCSCSMRFFGETFFTATFYVAKIIKVSPHHVAFSAISEVLNLKNFPGRSMPPDPPYLTHDNAFEVSPPNCKLAAQFSLRQTQFPPTPPARDLPLRPHLVRLLVGTHLPIKKNLATGLSYKLFNNYSLKSR